MTFEPAFEPIAIVGRACTLPGALSPEELWEAVVHGRDLLTRTPPGRWASGGESSLRHFLCRPEAPEPDRTWSDRGGYVLGFDEVFDPRGFLVPPEE
ncbi:MAG TPA: beta-ketoacyl synthase N-terminal-like domain-containing protein, partial [Thermoanaerobaculia bacterium]|nr:beta-ketoacyl synthase N-terminal-like domain-containing protein [Thermoanaerobaculia bacterium]